MQRIRNAKLVWRPGIAAGFAPRERTTQSRRLTATCLFIAMAATLVLSSLVEPTLSQTIAFGGPTMGTTYHVRVAMAAESTDVHGLKKEIDGLLAEVDRQMSTYRPDSELSRFNSSPAGNWFPVSTATAEVVAAAQAISEKTDGALDVTVGPLVRLWRFGPRGKSDKSSRRPFEPPSEQLLAAARDSVSFRNLDVQIAPPALRKEVDTLEVDLSSIAPGYAVDRMAEILRGHGIAHYMVEIGGEVRAAGHRSDGQPWRIAIERPLADRREMLKSIPLLNASISTAGGYRNFFEHGGRRYSHIIDPATAKPVDHALASVTVVAETCLAADGWDTPLLVLGPERGFECAVRNDIAALFVSGGFSKSDARPEELKATPAWTARFAGTDAPPRPRPQLD